MIYEFKGRYINIKAEYVDGTPHRSAWIVHIVITKYHAGSPIHESNTLVSGGVIVRCGGTDERLPLIWSIENGHPSADLAGRMLPIYDFVLNLRTVISAMMVEGSLAKKTNELLMPNVTGWMGFYAGMQNGLGHYYLDQIYDDLRDELMDVLGGTSEYRDPMLPMGEHRKVSKCGAVFVRGNMVRQVELMLDQYLTVAALVAFGENESILLYRPTEVEWRYDEERNLYGTMALRTPGEWEGTIYVQLHVEFE